MLSKAVGHFPTVTMLPVGRFAEESAAIGEYDELLSGNLGSLTACQGLLA